MSEEIIQDDNIEKIDLAKELEAVKQAELDSALELAKTKNYEIPKAEEEEIFDNYNLNATDKEYLKYRLKFPLMAQKEIAVLLNVTANHISKIANKEAVKDAIKEHDKKWWERYDGMRDKAMKELESLMNKKLDPKIKLEICKYVLQLDRIELVAVEKSKELSPDSNLQ